MANNVMTLLDFLEYNFDNTNYNKINIRKLYDNHSKLIDEKIR